MVFVKIYFLTLLLWQLEEELALSSPYPVPPWSSTFRLQNCFQEMDTEDDRYVQFPCSEHVANEQTSVLKIRAKKVVTAAVKISPKNLHDDDEGFLVQKLNGSWPRGALT